MDTYIGCKMVKAEPAAKEVEGKVVEGYKVVYPDGYESWSPKNVFESAYLMVDDNNGKPKINQDMVDNFISSYETATVGDKTTVVVAQLKNGFVMVEGSSCVDPKNYDKELGTSICLERIKNQIWKQLGFLLQTAAKGINN